MDRTSTSNFEGKAAEAIAPIFGILYPHKWIFLTTNVEKPVMFNLKWEFDFFKKQFSL